MVLLNFEQKDESQVACGVGAQCEIFRTILIRRRIVKYVLADGLCENVDVEFVVQLAVNSNFN